MSDGERAPKIISSVLLLGHELHRDLGQLLRHESALQLVGHAFALALALLNAHAWLGPTLGLLLAEIRLCPALLRGLHHQAVVSASIHVLGKASSVAVGAVAAILFVTESLPLCPGFGVQSDSLREYLVLEDFLAFGCIALAGSTRRLLGVTSPLVDVDDELVCLLDLGTDLPVT